MDKLVMSKNTTICIYTDPEFKTDGDNVFISMPYKSSENFEKNNKDMRLLVSYSLDHLLDKWSLLNELNSIKKLTQENNKLREALEKYANVFLGLGSLEINPKSEERYVESFGELARKTLREIDGDKK